MAKFSTGDLFDNRYKLLKELGGGQDAEVWTALDTLIDDDILVLKIFVRVGEKALDSFFDDFKLLKNLKHDHILKPFDIGKWESQPYQKLEFVKNGSIFKRVEEEKPFSEQEAAIFLSQVGSALAYLHENNIVHCDVKPENVLIKDDGAYALTDFGISQKMKNIFARMTMGKDADMTMFGFSRAYAPPEISNKSNIRASRDIFSLGASLYELLTGELPFDRDGGRALLMGVAIPELPETFSLSLNQLIYKCLDKEPEQRPTAKQLTFWANEFLETGTWNLETQISESSTIPSRKTIVSRGTTQANSNKFQEQKSNPIEVVNKRNQLLWIVGGIGVILTFGIIYLKTKADNNLNSQIVKENTKVVKDTNLALKTKTEALKLGKQAVQAKEPSANNQTDSKTLKNIKSTDNNKAPGTAEYPKDRFDQDRLNYQALLNEGEKNYKAGNIIQALRIYRKACQFQIASSDCQSKIKLSEERIEQAFQSLYIQGDKAIARNDKDGAIVLYTQARELILNSFDEKRLNIVAKGRYDDIIRRGNGIFESEMYENAKKWYLVAQSLINTTEVKQKIADCDKSN